MPPTSRFDPDAHVPLAPSVYNVLLALGERTLHGYGMIQGFEEMTGGAETLLPPDADPSGGPRRRYYRVTEQGRAVARAESERLGRLLDVARTQNLAPEAGP